jgi:hypothetical protein
MSFSLKKMLGFSALSKGLSTLVDLFLSMCWLMAGHFDLKPRRFEQWIYKEKQL